MTKLSGLGTESTFGLSDFLVKVKAAGGGDVNVTFQNLITALLGSGAIGSAVQTQANAGTAGGIMWWINLGGIKILWFKSASQTYTTNASGLTLTLPTSFFTTISSIVGVASDLGGDVRQSVSIQNSSTTTITITLWTVVGSSISGTANVLVIGT